MGETLEDLVEKLRDELDEQQDSYEQQIDDLTAEFEDKVEDLESKVDSLEGEKDHLLDERKQLLASHESELAKLKAEHEAEMLKLAASGNNWEKLFDDEGTPYFRNTITGETRWDDPIPLNEEGKALKADMEELRKEFDAIQKSFKKGKFMRKSLRSEVERLTESLSARDAEMLAMKEVIDGHSNVLRESDAKHAAMLLKRRKHEGKLRAEHAQQLKRAENDTLNARRELSRMRKEAKAMMDDMAQDLKNTYVVYNTKPGSRRV